VPAIPLLDLGFLAAETDAAHMHFGGLLIFEKPAPCTDFLANLAATWLEHERVEPPFNFVPVRDFASPWSLRWEHQAVVLDEHVHLLQLGGTGSYSDLLRLVEDLHSERLDRRRPLWQIYLIDGLAPDRCALFAKVHHALFDGQGGVGFLEQLLAIDGQAPAGLPFWAIGAGSERRPEPSALIRAIDALRLWRVGSAGLLRNALEGNRHLWRWLWNPRRVSPPAFSEPHSILNGRLSARRRIGHVPLVLADLQRVGRQLDATVNDVLLGICAGALRKYLQERKALPRRSLTALVPVSLRDAAAAVSAGNQLTFVPMSLATDIAGHAERVVAIRDGARDAKARIAALGEVGALQYGVLVNSLVALTQMVGMPGYLATPANLVVTNLLGPPQTRFLAGARLQAMYAHAPMANGVGLNIAMLSYAGSACIGLTADPHLVDDLDALAGYLRESADALTAPG